MDQRVEGDIHPYHSNHHWPLLILEILGLALCVILALIQMTETYDNLEPG